MTSALFHDLATPSGIGPQLLRVEAGSAIGEGERYHAPLQWIYQLLRNAHPFLDKQVILRLAFKGMNDTMGPEGLIS